MIYISRQEEPEFWKQFQEKHPGIRYNDLEKSEEGKQARKRLREFNVDQQHGLCAYCCCQITSNDSVNEHIKPQGKFAELSMQYTNIVASCRGDGPNGTCSAIKKDQYDECLFISPLSPDCESHFEFYRTGEIVSDTRRGKYMIKLLNLNSYRLCKARRAQLKVCESYHDDDMVRKVFLFPDGYDKLKPFVDIVRFFFGTP